MSVDEEKKFVIKHILTNLLGMADDETIYGEKEKHFGFLWRISRQKNRNIWEIYLECLNSCDSDDWSIETKVHLGTNHSFEKSITFTNRESKALAFSLCLGPGSFPLETNVRINKINGNFGLKKDRSFNESNKKFSDAVLKIDDEKFYVSKLSLAYHSTYFDSLFFGNFDESKQSEVELKDINPQDFQNFLELIHGQTIIDGDTVEGILHLADFFDSKYAIKRCEDFLQKNSQKTLKEKFELAIKYKLDKLMEKCLSDMKTKADLCSITPLDPKDLSHEMWKKLFEKALTVQN